RPRQTDRRSCVPPACAYTLAAPHTRRCNGQAMAEDSDLERSEPASERRLQQARERGQVPRSPELSTFSVLLAAGGGLMLLGSGLVQSLESVLRAALTLDRNA